MYPLLLPGMPLSERRELADRPDTDETDEAVDTERSSCGRALSASDGVAQGSGEEARSGGGEDAVSMVVKVDRGDVAVVGAKVERGRWA
jgi:hypothetical protein